MPPRKPKGDPLAHLEDGDPLPVYALYGDERILVDEALAAIKRRSVPTVAADFNLDLFVGKDATPVRIMEAARMLPAFAPRRTVIVKDADKLNAEALDALIEYVEDPSPTTTLIFVADKLDARTRFYKAVEKTGAVIKCEHPNIRDMPAIVKRRAKDIGLALDESAVRAIVDAIGNDVAQTVGALEKLLLYLGPRSRETATDGDVAEIVTHVREEAIWAIADAIADRDKVRALALLDGMIAEQRNHPLMVLGLIAGQWRKLALARALLDERRGGEIGEVLGAKGFVAEKLERQARRHGLSALTAGMELIAEADRGLKGGKLDGHRVMERLVLRLCR